MKNLIYLIILQISFFSIFSSCEDDDSIAHGSVNTGDVVNVGSTFAEIKGTYDAKSFDSDDYKVGVIYSLFEGLWNNDFCPAGTISGNKIRTTLTDLYPNSNYYYCTCILLNDSVIKMGEVQCFHTEDFEKIAIPDKVENPLMTEATIGFTIDESKLPKDERDRESLSYYMMYHADSSKVCVFNDANKIYSLSKDKNKYSAKLYNLNSGETYYYLVVTKMKGIDKYSEIESFTTPSILDYIDIDTTQISYESAPISFNSRLGEIYPTRERYYYLVLSENSDMSNHDVHRLNVYNTDSATFELASLTPGKTYYYQMRVETIENHTVIYINSKTLHFTTRSYPEPAASGFVDLGLSSGTLWAACNLGANEITDKGALYAWGETFVKEEYTEDNYTHIVRDTVKNTRTYLSIGEEISGTQYDAAYTISADQRMPTTTQVKELVNECHVVRKIINGIYGYLLIGKKEQAIFIPGEGTDEYNCRAKFWTGTTFDAFDAYLFSYYRIPAYFEDITNQESPYSIISRCAGYPIRPVRLPAACAN